MIKAHLYKLMADIEIERPTNLPDTTLNADRVRVGLQLVFGVAGGIALLVVALAGLRFVLSQGDAQKVSNARNAVIYALIGLVIALLGFSIVTFVVGRV